MLLNKSLWGKIAIVSGIAMATGVVVGGYFSISQLNKFNSYYVTPSDDTSRGFINAYKNAVYNGAQAILTPGYSHKDPINQSFAEYQDFFKNTGFLLFDEKFSKSDIAAKNSWSITFRSDLGSLQVGIAVGMLLNQYQDVFYNDGKLTYGIYGGLPFSSVTSFMGGFQKGIEWFNEKFTQAPNNKFLSLDGTREIEYKPIEMITSDIGYFAGGFGPSAGSSVSYNLLNKNADVIMPVAGPQIWTTLDQIIKLNKKCLLIGVDSAVEEDPLNKSLPFKSKFGEIGNGKFVQFSSMKNLALATDKALQIINNGNIVPEIPIGEDNYYFKNFSSNDGLPGSIGGFGTVAVGDIQNGCVGISNEGKKYLDKALELTNSTDPSLEPKYSEVNEMYFMDEKGEKWNYGEAPFGLSQEFVDLFDGEDRSDILNLKEFIKANHQADKEKIKVVISGSTSILLDSSFTQSCYIGLLNFLKSLKIDIPSPTAFVLGGHQ